MPQRLQAPDRSPKGKARLSSGKIQHARRGKPRQRDLGRARHRFFHQHIEIPRDQAGIDLARRKTLMIGQRPQKTEVGDSSGHLTPCQRR